MKLIVDVPESDIKFIKKTYKPEAYSQVATHFISTFVTAIVNGTPLPKGHGDLVDFDRLCEEYWDGNYMEIHKDDLSNIKPIIEADGGGEDEG